MPIYFLKILWGCFYLQSKTKAANDDFIDKTEFAKLLQYIRQYLELWVMFDAIDTSDDNRIELREFKKAKDALIVWGLKIDSDSEMEQLFKEVDADGGGKVLFDEFAHWAIKQNLDLEDDDDAEDAGEGGGVISADAIIAKKKAESGGK